MTDTIEAINCKAGEEESGNQIPGTPTGKNTMTAEKMPCACPWDSKYEGCIKHGMCVIQELELEIKKLKTVSDLGRRTSDTYDLVENEFRLGLLIDEIIMKVVEWCQGPLADDGVSIVECDSNRAKAEIRKLLEERQPDKIQQYFKGYEDGQNDARDAK